MEYPILKQFDTNIPQRFGTVFDEIAECAHAQKWFI